MSAAPQITPLNLEALAAAIAQALGHGRETRNGNTWRTYCPAHSDEGSPGLEVTVKDGKVLVKCWNGGCLQKEIIAALKLAGLWPDRPERRQLTLAQLAAAKRLPVEFLRANDVTDATGKYGAPRVHFGYRLEDGSLAPRYRVRVGLVGQKKLFWDEEGRGKGGIIAYGLHRLAEARKRGLLAFGEGESDALTLWLHEIPAIGFPGNTMVPKTLTAGMLIDVTEIIINQEPGEAGEKFRKDILSRLKTSRWAGKIRVIHWTPELKDPSELHRRDPDKFTDIFAEMVNEAEVIELSGENDVCVGDDHGDIAVAERFLAQHRENIRWCKGLGFFIWDQRRWTVDETERVYDLAKQVIRRMCAEAKQLLGTLKGDAIDKLAIQASKAEGFAVRSNSCSRRWRSTLTSLIRSTTY
jgi:hypothetical protein